MALCERLALIARHADIKFPKIEYSAGLNPMVAIDVPTTIQEAIDHITPQPNAPMDEAMAFTDSAVDAIQTRMADLGFVVPVRVISEGIAAAIKAQKEGNNHD